MNITTKSVLYPNARVLVPPPVNDNVLACARPLTAADVTAILDEHGPAIGAAIDIATQGIDFADNPYRALSVALLKLPDLQRWIVWYGSDLKRNEVDAFCDDLLIMAYAEVIGTTKSEYTADSMLDFLVEGLRPFSRYLEMRSVHG